MSKLKKVFAKKVFAEEVYFYDADQQISNRMQSPSRGVYRELYLEGGGTIWVTREYKEVPERWVVILEKEIHGR